MIYNSTISRADFDLQKIPENADQSKAIEIVNKTLTYLEFLNKNISLRSNFNCFIAEDISILAGGTVVIQHFLGVQPKWRIILRQTGNGVITDVINTPSDWNDKVVTLKNNGAENVVISVFIGRE